MGNNSQHQQQRGGKPGQTTEQQGRPTQQQTGNTPRTQQTTQTGQKPGQSTNPQPWQKGQTQQTRPGGNGSPNNPNRGS